VLHDVRDPGIHGGSLRRDGLGPDRAQRGLQQGCHRRLPEVPQYTDVVNQARKHALERLVENARSLGGNAVIGVRFDSSDVGDGLAEIVAYGTAVVIS
jgi:uncharacterized protein YbjQ (UPF0145 family)